MLKEKTIAIYNTSKPDSTFADSILLFIESYSHALLTVAITLHT